MSKQWQIRRGTSTENNGFTGAQGELTMDTDTNALRIHDGVTQGGHMIDSVVEWQVPTAENNYTWYRKYSSGWVEQGGSYLWSAGRQHTETVTFPVPMADARYSYSVTPHTPDRTEQGHGAWAEMLGVAYTTTTGLKLMIYGESDTDVNNGAAWRVEGMAA